jgi:lysozyme family protein
MSNFLPAYERVIIEEGGRKLTNNANDNGKQTYAGISRKFHPTWPGWKHIDSGSTPPAQLVRDFYHATFWLPIQGDAILDQRVAEAIYSMSINSEAFRKLAQVAVGVTPDGKFGAKTIVAINDTDPELFLYRFCVATIARYRDICVRDKTQRVWIIGWINRALGVLA